MRVAVFLLASVSLAISTPVEKQPTRQFFPHERHANHTRYIITEKNGKVEIEDLNTSKIEYRASPDDITLYMYTKNSLEDPTILRVNQIDILDAEMFKDKFTVFICHGWNNDYSSNVNKLIKAAALEIYDVNVFVVDWSGPANHNYITASNAVTTIGAALGDFINNLVIRFDVSPDRIILAGHSLGAHVAGAAGAQVNGQIEHIVGMDPASPLFSLDDTDKRLDTTDAKFVHVIHTNAGFLGFSSAIGHADYFPNGGHHQPGCGLDLIGTCSHSRSYQYFAESLRVNKFLATQCEDFNEFEKENCERNIKSYMGGFKVDKNVNGDFFLFTNSEEPFGQG